MEFEGASRCSAIFALADLDDWAGGRAHIRRRAYLPGIQQQKNNPSQQEFVENDLGGQSRKLQGSRPDLG